MEAQQVDLSSLHSLKVSVVALTKHLNDIGLFATKSDFVKIRQSNFSESNVAVTNAIYDLTGYRILTAVGGGVYHKYVKYGTFPWRSYPQLIGSDGKLMLSAPKENQGNLYFVHPAYASQAEDLKREMIPELMVARRETGI